MFERKLSLPEVDPDTINLKPSWRERVALRLLWLMFQVVYPTRYPHQKSELYGQLFNGFDE